MSTTYVEYLSEDEDDEIEVIPFVKPTPPVIDLVEDDEDQEQSRKSSGKGKKGKKKKKKDSALPPNPDDGDEDDSVTILENGLESDFVTTAQNKETGNSVQAEKAGRNVEQSSAGAEVRNETLSSNSSSKNVAGRSRASKNVANENETQLLTALPIPIEELSNTDNDGTGSGSGSSSVSTLTVGSTNDTPSSSPASKSNKRSAEPKRARRMTQLSATRKTAAEISSFLNTLGIPIEVRDLTPQTTRKPRAKRKSVGPTTPVENPEPGPGNTNVAEADAGTPSQSPTKKRSKTSQPEESNESTPKTRKPRPSPRGKRKSMDPVSTSEEVIQSVAEEKNEEENPSRSPTKKKSKISKQAPVLYSLPGQVQVEEEATVSGNIPNSDARQEKFSKEKHDLDGKSVPEESEPSPSPTKKKSKPPKSMQTIQETNPPTEEVAVAEKSSSKKQSKDKVPKEKESKKRGDPKSVPVPDDKIDESGRSASPKKKAKTGSRSGSVEEKQKKDFIYNIVIEEESEDPDKNNSIRETSEQENPEKTSRKERPTKESKKRDENKEKEKKEKSVRRKEKEKRAEIDSQNMPPPPPPPKNRNVASGSSRQPRRRSPDYYTNHPGFPLSWTDDMKEYYGAFRGANFNERDVKQRQSKDRSKWRAPLDTSQRRKVYGPRCVTCHQHGHVSRNCPDKNKPLCCSMCGGKGHKFDSGGRNRCPKACCLNCGRRSENFSTGCRDCIYQRQPPRCSLCHISGHKGEYCPDNWRRFHSITTPLPTGSDEILTSKATTMYKENYDLYCCNCATPGHNYYDCNAHRYKQNPYHRNSPYVIKEIDIEKIAAKQSEQQQQPISLSSPTNLHAQETRTSTSTTVSPNNRVESVNRNINVEMKTQGEFISVQIRNETQQNVEVVIDDLDHRAGPRPSARSSDPKILELLPCAQHPDCSNRTSKFQKCNHIAVNSYQQSLLLKAKDDGEIDPIEKKCNVNISILRQVLIVHISGENWKEAENELYEILFTKAKAEQSLRDKNVRPNPCFNSSLVGVGSSSAQSAETTRTVVNDGENISVMISKTLFLEKQFPQAKISPEVFYKDDPLHLVPSMDVDERFASPQDLIQNIPIIRPDGPFAPGHFIPYSALRQELAPGAGAPNPTFAATPAPMPLVTIPIQNQREDNPLPSTSAATINFLNSSTIVNPNPQAKTIVVATIDDSDDEVIILEEVKEPPKRIQQVLKKLPPSPVPTQIQIPDEGLNVVLLRSEWDVVFSDYINKDGIIRKIAKLFDVTICVSKEENSCTIRGGSEYERKLAKEKVTLWLGTIAAKTPFVLHTPGGDSPKTSTGIPNGHVNISATNTNKRNSSPKKRSSAMNKSRNFSSSASPRRPVQHRYNPTPNTNPSSSSGQRGAVSRGSGGINSGRRPQRFQSRPLGRGRFTYGESNNRNNNDSHKPLNEPASKRFRYFH